MVHCERPESARLKGLWLRSLPSVTDGRSRSPVCPAVHVALARAGLSECGRHDDTARAGTRSQSDRCDGSGGVIAYVANQESRAPAKQQRDGCRQRRVIRLAHFRGNAAGPPSAATLLSAWQRHSEPGPAARVEAVVAPPGTTRPGCARSRQGTEFAESRFRASRVTFVRRQRPYRGSPRSRSGGCCSARAKRSSHRCRDRRCSVSWHETACRRLCPVPAVGSGDPAQGLCWENADG
jgi:hypothetical protein